MINCCRRSQFPAILEMKHKKTAFKFVIAFVSALLTFQGATQESKLSWWSVTDATSPIIEGKGWYGTGIGTFSRLPEKAKHIVRKPVWDLAQQSAGLSVRFLTNSGQIVVRYKVSGNLNMYHMPSSGVSGLDLYAKDSLGNWMWKNGHYSFQDTITCNFSPINRNEDGIEYRLYLPLYNSVEWMEIGVLENSTFKVLPARTETPIVVYGTSIAQGACSTRPGLAWVNILSRKLDLPVVNLGFSGNGRLEPEVVNLINEIDARLYVLDCLPNMIPGVGFTTEETYSRIISSVKQLKQEHPGTPVLLVEHAGYSDGGLDKERYKLYTELNHVQRKAYTDLLEQGTNQLYYLSKEELNLDISSFVDGTHPNDLGMMSYALAYERKLGEIFDLSCNHIQSLKVMSYNIHYGLGMDGKYDLERIARIIKKENPDIVGLQEIGDSLMAAELGRLTGMPVVFGPSLGKMDGYGDAILCKFPFEWINNYPIPSASSSRYQAMAIDVDISEKIGKKTNMRIVNTHFDWLETLGSREARLAAVDVIEKGFFKNDILPAILTGDLNATPGSEPLRKLQSKGWVYESLGKDLRTIRAGNPEKQIDYVLFRPRKSWKVTNVRVLDEPVASDHLPVLMTLTYNNNWEENNK